MSNVQQYAHVVHICDPWKFLVSGNQREERCVGPTQAFPLLFKFHDVNLTETTIYDNKSKSYTYAHCILSEIQTMAAQHMLAPLSSAGSNLHRILEAPDMTLTAKCAQAIEPAL